jgi:hypothetical protein
MKSFNQQTEHELDREQLDEELNKKVTIDEATAGDFLLGLGAAGGLLALKKGWDMFGKGTKLQTGLAKIGLGSKTKAAQAALDREDQKQKDQETRAKGDTVGLDKDEDGNLKQQGDAQAYKDKTGKAPSGWETSPKSSPGKGKVWTKDDQTKWDADAKDREAAQQDKSAALKAKLQKKQDDKKQGKLDKAKASGDFGKAGTSAKSKQKVDRKAAAKKELEKRAQQNQSFIPIPSTLSDLEEEDRTQLLEELVLEETMTITESNELQAIMALDDIGISAEINRKGEVAVKKKDLKKAQKALKKSFKKGGEPKLVGEEVELTEALGKLDKSVIDAFYYKKEKAGKIVSTDGDSLNKTGMGGQTIAQWLDPSGKIAISAVTDVKSTESILNYMKKSIPKGNFDKKSYKKFFGEELQRTAYELVSEARKKAVANKPKWEQE